MIDHAFFELAKISPAGAPHVHCRGHAAPQGKAVRRKRVEPAAIGAVRVCAEKGMNMDVDQARSDD